MVPKAPTPLFVLDRARALQGPQGASEQGPLGPVLALTPCAAPPPPPLCARGALCREPLCSGGH